MTRFLSFFLSSFLLSFFLCPLCRHCRRSRPLSPCPPVAAVLLSLCPHRVRTRIGVSSHPCAEPDVPRTTKYKVGLIYRVTDVVVAHSLDTVGGGASHVVPMSPLDKTKNNTEQRRGQWLSHADSNRTYGMSWVGFFQRSKIKPVPGCNTDGTTRARQQGMSSGGRGRWRRKSLKLAILGDFSIGISQVQVFGYLSMGNM